jgi:phage gpG-like protein
MSRVLNKQQQLVLVNGIVKIMANQPRSASAKAVAFFKGNFRRQGFPMNGRLDRWEKRKAPDKRKGAAILKKTGRLQRSIRTTEASRRRVVVGTDVPYAEAHNEGLELEQKVNVPAHSRREHKYKAHRRAGKKIKGGRRKAADVKGHSRQLSVNLPIRQFIGASPDLMKSIDREYLKQVKELERQIFKK